MATIPRRSGNEAAARDYIKSIAMERGLRFEQDVAGNLVVYVPGKGSGLGKDPVILQGHLDMVCDASPGSAHDFDKDPIRLREAQIDGRAVVTATATTLGADNGLGVCTALGVIIDPTLTSHPPLELLFTIDEEIGLNGAKGLDAALIKGRRLINLDSEDGPREIYVSCAGGRNLEAVWRLSRVDPQPGFVPVAVKLSGLPGGHSGLEIQHPRGQAIFNLIDLLNATSAKGQLAHFSGGTARNIIPPKAEAIVWLPAAQTEGFITEVLNLVDRVCEGGPRAVIEVEQLSSDAAPIPFAGNSANAALAAIRNVPHGVLENSELVAGLVQTSNNVAMVTCADDILALTCMTRSSRGGALDAFQPKWAAELEKSGATTALTGQYSAWEADANNPLLLQALRSFEGTIGVTPQLRAVHAGLECGVLCGRLPGLKAISFGPEIRGAHSPNEVVFIDSVPPFYKALVRLLADLSE